MTQPANTHTTKTATPIHQLEPDYTRWLRKRHPLKAAAADIRRNNTRRQTPPRHPHP